MSSESGLRISKSVIGPQMATPTAIGRISTHAEPRREETDGAVDWQLQNLPSRAVLQAWPQYLSWHVSGLLQRASSLFPSGVDSLSDGQNK